LLRINRYLTVLSKAHAYLSSSGGATTSLASRDYQYSNLGMVSSLNKSIHSSLAAGITSLDYSFSYDDKGRLLGSTLATGGMNRAGFIFH
jgi:hypothetical protein